MSIVKYIWPIWGWIVFQFSWNTLLLPFHGNFDSKVGDWLYGRNCNYGYCDGTILVLIVAILFGAIFVGNAIYQIVKAWCP